jgi:tetratricopeptide (TPR) repeat protein
VYYGCGWAFRAKTPQYPSAISHFHSAAAAEPSNAVAHFLLGAALAGDGQADSARASLTRALRLDPDVMRALAPRLDERPALRARIEALLRGEPPTTPVAATPEARIAGNDRPNDVRAPQRAAVPAAVPSAPPSAPPAPPGALVLGAYACTHDTWSGPPSARRRVSEPKGSLLLRADGTYRYLENGADGRYRYDAATGSITWQGGGLATMRPERTTYRRNRATAQIDVRLTGVYEWSCGINLP